MPQLGVALVLALAGCGGTETVTTTVTETETLTQTHTETETETRTETASAGLPAAVEETRAGLLEAAHSGDYARLEPFVHPDLSYSFGGPVEGGPVAYWQELERSSDERPLETLAALLEQPYALHGGIYVWPFAFPKPESELTDYERELLGELAEGYAGGVYLGWRAGIRPDGTWAFFIAGD